MKRYVIEREVIVTEVTDVVADSPEAALAAVSNTWVGWDRVDWEYGRPYIVDVEDDVIV